MKLKSLFASLLVLSLLICTFAVPTSAKEPTNTNVEIVINGDVSEETKAKIERHFASNTLSNADGATTYGLMCDLFGHKLESTAVAKITHKVLATSPRCKKQTYNYETCTRCDYEKSTLIKTEYIVCC